MNFEEARKHILAAIHSASSVLDEPRYAGLATMPEMDVGFDDLGLDSLAAMEICMALEEKAGIEIDLGDLAIHPSVNMLARHVATRAKG
jgi:acyl carrier protein